MRLRAEQIWKEWDKSIISFINIEIPVSITIFGTIQNKYFFSEIFLYIFSYPKYSVIYSDCFKGVSKIAAGLITIYALHSPNPNRFSSPKIEMASARKAGKYKVNASTPSPTTLISIVNNPSKHLIQTKVRPPKEMHQNDYGNSRFQNIYLQNSYGKIGIIKHSNISAEFEFIRNSNVIYILFNIQQTQAWISSQWMIS